MKRSIAAALLLLAAATAPAQENLWKDRDGKPSPESDARRSVDGMGGWLLVTPDEDWSEKWNTPAETIPEFKEANVVARGKPAFVLIFVSNPKVNAAGEADVACNIEVIKPDGTPALSNNDLACIHAVLKGAPFTMYLSAPVVKFVGDPGDPAGKWSVRVTLKDKLRSSSLVLRTSFFLE